MDEWRRIEDGGSGGAPLMPEAPQTISGVGTGDTAPFILRGGNYSVRYATSGPRYFSLLMRSTNDTFYRRIVTATGPTTGIVSVYGVPRGLRFYLHPSCEPGARWTATFSPQ